MTPYYYSTFERRKESTAGTLGELCRGNDSIVTDKEKIVVLVLVPNRYRGRG